MTSPLADGGCYHALEGSCPKCTPVRQFAQALRGAFQTGRRTPEAQADIQAARAAPTDMEIAMQEADRAYDQALHEFRNAPIAYCAHGDQPVEVTGLGHHGVPLDAALSNAALADTPAVREMGGPRNMQSDLVHAVGALERVHRTLWPHRDPFDVTLDDLVHGVATIKIERDEARAHGERMRLELEQARQPGAVVLIGTHAAQYRALADAARKAQASAATARADGAALLQLFQAFCAGVDSASEKT